MKDEDSGGFTQSEGRQIPDRLSSRIKEESGAEADPAEEKTNKPAGGTGASEDWQKLFAAIRRGMDRLRE
ncbi:hypothetical protein [Paenibacillus tarimensis]|uniref:hypothetical protein n=1 Tax=Paenibacillus tarimensis TaxID=416012 RepID=UPI001F46B992|nr:hypothetical protein [Paenibacillus tarimensis]MCF2943058.1 hypothetical protein [Paenibacillus tarimensis]